MIKRKIEKNKNILSLDLFGFVIMPCPHYKNGERTCKQICKNVLHLIDEEFCKTDYYKNCPYYQIIKNPEALCEYIQECNENDFAFTLDFQQMISLAKNYCLNSKNKEKCARYISLKKGKKPHIRLLPDGKILYIS